ncbi:uncharacterized protein LOC117336266 isoform X2 [Pecten maximus]|uniref:uncharacterized protein LOC117336266 isoform X2 n=1 Tax=Pecten maximus TaxID=6579 RepID=UPI00145918E3|nr:uncharacterized protein LOC117336266 isoform X2 [Pecten maximus]
MKIQDSSFSDSKSEEAPVLEVNCSHDNSDLDPSHIPYWMRTLTPDMSYLLSDKKCNSRLSTLPEYSSLLRESDSSSEDDEEIWTERSPIIREGGNETEIIELHLVKEDEEIHTERIKKEDHVINIPPVWRFIQGILIVLIIALVSFLLIRFMKRPWENSGPVAHHHDTNVT